MTKHGPRFMTTFAHDETDAIIKELKALATNHNRLLRDFIEINIDDWRNAVLPPKVRELALQTQAVYGKNIYASAYVGTFAIRLRPGLTLYANWGGHPECFPRPGGDTVTYLYEDVASEFVQRLYDGIDEWHRNAVNYGLVLDVFDWLNGKRHEYRDDTTGFCGKGERRWLRTILPGIVAVVGRFNPDLARSLVAPLSGIRPPIPPEYIDGIRKANQTIAASLIVPPHAGGERHISLSLSSSHSVSLPIWPCSFSAHYDV